jgi:hypothetical protein
VFSDLVVGIEINCERDIAFVKWIDKNANAIAVPHQYWDEHPIFGGMIYQEWTDNRTSPMAHDMVRIPGFYTTAESPSKNIHRIWISPTPSENFYLHPAFVSSPSGVLISGALVSGTNETAVSKYDVAGTTNTVLTALFAANPKAKKYDIHLRAALWLLMAIERQSINFGITSFPGYGVANDITAKNYRGIRSVTPGSNGNNYTGNVYMGCFGLTIPNDSILTVTISLPGSEAVDYSLGTWILDADDTASGFRFASSILTGFDSNIGAHAELYFIGKTYSNQAPFTKYRSLLYLQGSNGIPTTNYIP